MIVISSPTAIINEIEIIQNLFQEGMNLFHIRKPDYSEEEMKNFLSNIDDKFYSKLVLHEQHHLAQEFKINRIHLKEKERIEVSENFQKTISYLSTSVHNINDFNELPSCFNATFLSPVFASISKDNYGKNSNIIESIKCRTNFNTELIALGGIKEDTIKLALDSGFDNVALLGAIWLAENPIQKFKKCQKIVHSY
ncbi:thiamine phosphate synthase [Flavobacterium urocaniciphilum]|uniref:Thiamine-phosphate pyrophosphorylase n=1 Tax=Flavobacterium urocaniciphilum TaxID=1299341 RepID=A0A1H8YW35_9FLAO|nr:thiamine phosphate synthase [Flavobacterium urocaniciphilum]SEP56271.1 thiamine-phosphate pyrophosphorylase [Flavobacterium urocaniciphilum]